jgi:hypothetical protein
MGIKRIWKTCPHTKRPRNTDWSPPTPADIKTLLGVVINMGLQLIYGVTDNFSQAWVKKINCHYFQIMFPKDEFQLFFWNLHFAHAEGQGQLKKMI